MAKRYDPIMCMMVDEPTKAQDAGFVLRHKNGQYMSSAGRTNEKAKAKVFSSKREAEAYKGDYVVSSTDPDYHNWSVVAVDSASTLDKAIKTCDAVDDIYVRRSNEYYVNVKLGKSNPQISATISRILNKDKRVDGVLGSPGNWDVAIEGKDNAEYIKKILSGVGNIK